MIYLNDDLSHFDWQSALPQLSDQRREQALKFRHEQGRRECVAAYMLLRQALLKEYGIQEPPLFTYGEHGKPAIVGHPAVHFNLSHCREAVLCVVGDVPVGVDVESLRKYKEPLAGYTMNEEEQAAILGSECPAAAFTRLWTQKEAVLKLSGTGITNDLKTVLTDFSGQLQTVETERYIYSIATNKTEQL